NSKNVNRPQYRTGAPNRAARPAGAAAIGGAWGNHITGKSQTEDYRGQKVFTGPSLQSKLGNQVAAETRCGVGGRRTIHKTGSQQGLVTRANNPRGRSFDV